VPQAREGAAARMRGEGWRERRGMRPPRRYAPLRRCQMFSASMPFLPVLSLAARAAESSM